ncbi:hypothetical protein LY90DRAFT_515890 [Neocallimastix californiae]|uniref:Uncharacterized protein n=1 Tax=Neocallimastix californiae TaxID=1754190 RepID=A0A1Y2AH03_9FUNG|nr:hypothetical protein LY90DRAFT_515890 [Neocallimastix californiae]|eukprot:ORY21841.1 hypothetical protein LY90DRAFT_515890 [Neocallimastix californiae]
MARSLFHNEGNVQYYNSRIDTFPYSLYRSIKYFTLENKKLPLDKFIRNLNINCTGNYNEIYDATTQDKKDDDNSNSNSDENINDNSQSNTENKSNDNSKVTLNMEMMIIVIVTLVILIVLMKKEKL